MTGIYLDEQAGGVGYDAADSAFSSHNDSPSCQPLYFPKGCGVPIPSDMLNAWISEIACAVDSIGLSYDCGIVCNLHAAVMGRASMSGYCGTDRADAEAQKGSALAPGDRWFDTDGMVAYYVDGGGVDVAFDPQPQVFYCCKTGAQWARCDAGWNHLAGTGEVVIPRLEGICSAAGAPPGITDGQHWVDMSEDPRVVRKRDGGNDVVVSPQPEFFACCADQDKKLLVRCGGSYFYFGEQAGSSGGTGVGWVEIFLTAYSTSGFFTNSEIGRSLIDTSGLDWTQVIAAATKVRVTVGAGGDDFHLQHLCMGEALDSTGYDHTAAGTVDVQFSGSNQIVIPAGETRLSDEISYNVDPATFQGFWFGFKAAADYTYNRPNRVDSITGARGGYKSSSNTCGNVTGLNENPGRCYLIRKIEVYVP